MAMQRYANIVEMVEDMANRQPDADAVVLPRRKGDGYQYDRRSFRDLYDDIQDIESGMVHAVGVRRGMKIVLLVPHGYEFIALTFAVLKTGATLVLIDPGMGKRNVLRCLQSIHPDGFVGSAVVSVLRRFVGRRFPNANCNVIVGRKLLSTTPTLDQVRQAGRRSRDAAKSEMGNDAAIIFTSGSTGPAKGVLFSHANFVAQAEQIRDFYQITPGGYDLAAFPLFGLFNAAMGTTTVVPDMNAAKPASVEPRRYVQHLRDLQISQSFASPAVWNALGQYCQERQLRLPSLKRVLVAGAPVPPRTLSWITASISSEGEMHTPYGATEALPVASISAREVLRDTAQRTLEGGGICVGRRFAAIQWKVIEISDDPIPEIGQARECCSGEIGELIVQGPQVTRSYATSEQANAAAKIRDGNAFWHRMGDVGYLDEQNRFWFCGRKAHRVRWRGGTLFTVPVESLFNEHPHIYRSALVEIPIDEQPTPVVICEPWPKNWPRGRRRQTTLKQQLLELAQTHELTADISLKQILLKRKLPVDTRHNSKIFREQLVPWAIRKFGRM